MAYLVKADLASHTYIENVDEITRDDDTQVTKAINAAVSMAKGYLSRFNRTKLFVETDPDFVTDENLKSKVKDMACFNLLTLCNANMNYDVFDNLNKLAISWLKDVQSGKVDPEGWPYKDDDAATDYPENNTVSMITNPKRSNHY